MDVKCSHMKKSAELLLTAARRLAKVWRGMMEKGGEEEEEDEVVVVGGLSQPWVSARTKPIT